MWSSRHCLLNKFIRLAICCCSVVFTPEALGESPSLVGVASPAWAENLLVKEGLPAFFSKSWLQEQWKLSKTEGWAEGTHREVRQAVALLEGYRLSRLTKPDLLRPDGCFEKLPWDHLAERNWPTDWRDQWGSFEIPCLVESSARALHAQVIDMEQGYYAGVLGTLYKIEPLEWFGGTKSDGVDDPHTPRYFFLKVYEIGLGGVTICADRGDFWTFDIDDEVFLLGGEIKRPKFFFSAGHAFPIQDGLVLPQAYPGLLPGHLPVPLESLQ